MNPFRSLMGRRQFIAGALAASTSALFYKNIAKAFDQGSSVNQSKPQMEKGIKRHKIVAFGNQGMPLGHAMAADLSLSGHDVTILDMPENHEKFETIKKQGGINVTGNPEALSSGKIGFAKIETCTIDPKEALDGADLIFVDAPIHEIEKWVTHIVPYIQDNAILNFNYYGYWPSLRIYPILKAAGKENVTITECPSAFWLPRGRDGQFEYTRLREGLPLSVFPANRTGATFKILNNLFPSLVPAQNVIETNFMNLNMIWHSSIALLNVAYFNRVKASGEDRANFYGTGITESTSLLAGAQDKEREAVCDAFNVPYRPLMELINQFSKVTGKTIFEAQRNAVKGSGPQSVDSWKLWVGWDIPFAIVPFVSLAELAGVEMPIHKGLTHIFGAILEKDFWEEGLTLDRLGLKNKSAGDVIKYVNDGM